MLKYWRDVELLLLIVISAAGLGLSAIIHVCSLFQIYEPPRQLMILIQAGFAVVFYPTYIISNKMSNKANIKDFKKALFGACPGWLSIMMGLLIIYTLVWLMFCVFERYFGGSVSTKWQGIMVISGILMAFYCLVFTLLYSCRRLRRDVLFERNQPVARD